MNNPVEIEHHDKDWAQRITDRIRAGLESLSADIIAARQGAAHELLGYASWDEYATTEFLPVVSALASPIKRAMIRDLSEAGFKQREIAAATGVAQPNVSRALRDISGDISPRTPEEIRTDMKITWEGARASLIDATAAMIGAGVPEQLVVDAFVGRFRRDHRDQSLEAVDLAVSMFESVIRDAYEVAREGFDPPTPQPLDVQLALLREVDNA